MMVLKEDSDEQLEPSHVQDPLFNQYKFIQSRSDLVLKRDFTS